MMKQSVYFADLPVLYVNQNIERICGTCLLYMHMYVYIIHGYGISIGVKYSVLSVFIITGRCWIELSSNPVRAKFQ